MIYSENERAKKRIRRANRRKQLIAWCIVLFIGFSIGAVVVSGIAHLFFCTSAKASEPCDGVITEQMLSGEIPEEWTVGVETKFVPLDVPMDKETQEFIYYLSYGYNIDFPFVMALIETESGFNPNAVSATNDCGLMQINKINHGYLTKAVGVTNFFDPYQNVCAGTFMLKNLFEKYDDPAKVLMAYNMGEGGASRLWKQGVYESNYSNKVMNKALQYKEQISKGEPNA